MCRHKARNAKNITAVVVTVAHTTGCYFILQSKARDIGVLALFQILLIVHRVIIMFVGEERSSFQD